MPVDPRTVPDSQCRILLRQRPGKPQNLMCISWCICLIFRTWLLLQEISYFILNERTAEDFKCRWSNIHLQFQYKIIESNAVVDWKMRLYKLELFTRVNSSLCSHFCRLNIPSLWFSVCGVTWHHWCARNVQLGRHYQRVMLEPESHEKHHKSLWTTVELKN